MIPVWCCGGTVTSIAPAQGLACRIAVLPRLQWERVGVYRHLFSRRERSREKPTAECAHAEWRAAT